MLNQLRFERNDFRKYVIRFHKIIIEKNNNMHILHEAELMIKQINNIARNYQKKIIKLQRKINIIKLKSLKKDSKNDHSNNSFEISIRFNLDIQKRQVYKAI